MFINSNMSVTYQNNTLVVLYCRAKTNFQACNFSWTLFSTFPKEIKTLIKSFQFQIFCESHSSIPHMHNHVSQSLETVQQIRFLGSCPIQAKILAVLATCHKSSDGSHGGTTEIWNESISSNMGSGAVWVHGFKELLWYNISYSIFVWMLFHSFNMLLPCDSFITLSIKCNIHSKTSDKR